MQKTRSHVGYLSAQELVNSKADYTICIIYRVVTKMVCYFLLCFLASINHQCQINMLRN